MTQVVHGSTLPVEELINLVERQLRDDPWGNFYWSRASAELKYVWICVPKVASVTTWIALRELDGNPYTDGSLYDDEGVTRLLDFTAPEIVEMFTSPDWYRFCFVRNPYGRLFAAYTSKIRPLNAEPFYQEAQRELRETLALPEGTIIPFGDFADQVLDGWRPGDGHWCTQIGRLMPHMINYDFVGRFESFADDIAHVLRRLEAADAVFEAAGVKRGATTDMPLAAAYEPDLAARVYEWYREDFDFYGYDRDSWRIEI